jgi:hypothetical protein
MPRGGARDLALQQSQISKEGAIGATESNAYLSSFPALAQLGGQGIGLSTAEISSALSAFGGASSSNQAAGQMSSAGKAETLSFLGGLGSSAAQGAGLALGCWIAEEIFGERNLHTVRLRVWLNAVFGKTRTGKVVMFFYRRHGRYIALQVRNRPWVRRLITPIFMAADRAAYRWELEWAHALKRAGLIA